MLAHIPLGKVMRSTAFPVLPFSAWLVLVGCAAMGAAPLTATDDPAAATLVDAPGREVVQRVCSECHDAAKHITKFKKSEDEWAAVITDMQSRGLMADDKDIETVLAYLTRNYGPKEGGQ
jgi:cytochrome c5